MPAQPTKEQLESRQEVDDFLTRVGKRVHSLVGRSKWFSRPDSELKAWVERGAMLEEVKDSRWHQLQLRTLEQEIFWAQTELEIGKLDSDELRAYLRALRFVRNYIADVQKNAEISNDVLQGRVKELEKVTFISGGMNDRSRHNG